MDVLIYSGPGVAQDLLKDTVEVFRKLLGENYAVSLIGPKEVGDEPWMDRTKLFVLPGGRDAPYMEHLAGEGNLRIRTFVEGGGKFIGFCAGAYYSCDSLEFESGTELQMAEDRPLKFFPGLGRGAAFRGFHYESEDGARAAPTTFEFLQAYPTLKCPIYWDGGGAFINAHSTCNVNVLATYDDISDESENAAAVLCKVGDKGGEALLSFVHPEYKPKFPHLFNELNSASPEIEELLFRWLKLIGLSVGRAFERHHSASPIKLIFLDGFAHDNNLEFYAEELANELKKPLRLIISGLESLESAPFQIKAYSEALKSEAVPSFNSFGSPLLYAEVTTSTQEVFQDLRNALPSGAVFVASRQVSGKGKSLLCTLTSASGRGTNIWVSPLGCLQFSLFFNHPLPDRGAPVVLIQYLAAVAIIDAVRAKPGYEQLPLRIKWPNDIYTMDPSSANMDKIGGILVNTFYTKGACNVIVGIPAFFSLITLPVGIGLNVTNSHPTLCINDLVNQLNKERSNKLGLPALPLLTQETLLARILSQLQAKYSTFLTQQAGLSPFLETYYRHWLHTDQVVTLSAHGVKARIAGIHPHSGFLEAISDEGERYELQPDGNSFDMMAGLISIKSPYSASQTTTCI